MLAAQAGRRQCYQNERIPEVETKSGAIVAPWTDVLAPSPNQLHIDLECAIVARSAADANTKTSRGPSSGWWWQSARILAQSGYSRSTIGVQSEYIQSTVLIQYLQQFCVSCLKG